MGFCAAVGGYVANRVSSYSGKSILVGGIMVAMFSAVGGFVFACAVRGQVRPYLRRYVDRAGREAGGEP